MGILNSIKLLSRDSTCDLPEEIASDSKTSSEQGWPYRVAVVVRVNGCTSIILKEDRRIRHKVELNYRLVKEIAMNLLLKTKDDSIDYTLACDTVRRDGELASLQADSLFWEETTAMHHSLDGHKIKDAPLKYDFNVSVLVNGYLLFNGWELIGSDRPIDYSELQNVFAPKILEGMLQGKGDLTTGQIIYPTVAEIRLIFAWPRKEHVELKTEFAIHKDAPMIMEDSDFEHIRAMFTGLVGKPLSAQEASSLLISGAYLTDAHLDLSNIVYGAEMGHPGVTDNYIQRQTFQLYNARSRCYYDVVVVLDKYTNGTCRIKVERIGKPSATSLPL